MKKFDTRVQELKYEVLKEIARLAFEESDMSSVIDIPKKIIPGKEATMRCCVYKERAILAERVKLAMGGDKDNPNVIEVIDIACDDCPVGGYEVSNACRGCIAHRCASVCPRDAISFDHDQHAFIDKTKCIECGKCASVCPYVAIINHKRPCEVSCKVKAISMSKEKSAYINNDKCIQCGACVYQCPFGAIVDKSFILDVISILKESKKENYSVYAVVAPSIVTQFSYAHLGQVIAGIEKLGFAKTVEAALGADMVSYLEAKELEEKGFLTSSCCPAFVSYIEKNFPNLVDKISSNFSPAAFISKYIKEQDPTAKVVFIGPCTAKKMEFQKETVKPYIDSVITFEELQALLDAADIDITLLTEKALDNASYFGRIFARSGGLSEAVQEALKEQKSDFTANPVVCSGIEECRVALLRANKGVLPNNFIEGMACVHGCIGGAGCLTHIEKNVQEIDKYGKEAKKTTIQDSIETLK